MWPAWEWRGDLPDDQWGDIIGRDNILFITFDSLRYDVARAALHAGLSGLGYRTVCIGGVGFFSNQTKLGRVLPGLFQESYWSPRTGTDYPDSTRHQVDIALEVLRRNDRKPVFLFLNVAATHTARHMYLPGETRDSWESRFAALAYADTQLGRLLAAMPGPGRWLIILCADHGEAFGEDGHHGHGIAHPSVWTVPYAENILGPDPNPADE